MSEKNICPGCGRHCNLSEPNCSRGEEYRRTGNMPGQHEKGHHHRHHDGHRYHGGSHGHGGR